MTQAASGVPQAGTLHADLRALISQHFATASGPLGVAVSGGSDSLALLYLLIDWGGAPLRCVTVDHGLRAESAEEARTVARHCARLDIPHDTLNWTGWDGRGNLPAKARSARYAMMADWATVHQLRGVVLGHTEDDVAETFLMRLARRAGVDGLAAMQPRRREGGITLHRPLLQASRADLRKYLEARDTPWIDDPSNSDARYRRTQARRALEALAPVGVTADALADVAHHLAQASDTLGHYAAEEAQELATVQHGDLLLDGAGFRALRGDIARRILQTGLRWITGADYGARGPDLTRLLENLDAGQGGTLAGCRITQNSRQIRLTREYAAIDRIGVSPDVLWDNRWRLSGPPAAGAVLAPLGPRGRETCPDWRKSGLPAHSVEATVALWQGDVLLSAPLAGYPNGWSAEPRRTWNDFHAMLLSH